VQLKCIPESPFRVARIAAAHQKVHRRIVLGEQIGCDMRADVAG